MAHDPKQEPRLKDPSQQQIVKLSHLKDTDVKNSKSLRCEKCKKDTCHLPLLSRNHNLQKYFFGYICPCGEMRDMIPISNGEYRGLEKIMSLPEVVKR